MGARTRMDKSHLGFDCKDSHYAEHLQNMLRFTLPLVKGQVHRGEQTVK